jgi:hypothetical protein
MSRQRHSIEYQRDGTHKKKKFRRDVIKKDNPSTEQRHTYKTGDRLEGKTKKNALHKDSKEWSSCVF